MKSLVKKNTLGSWSCIANPTLTSGTTTETLSPSKQECLKCDTVYTARCCLRTTQGIKADNPRSLKNINKHTVSVQVPLWKVHLLRGLGGLFWVWLHLRFRNPSNGTLPGGRRLCSPGPWPRDLMVLHRRHLLHRDDKKHHKTTASVHETGVYYTPAMCVAIGYTKVAHPWEAVVWYEKENKMRTARAAGGQRCGPHMSSPKAEKTLASMSSATMSHSELK